MRGSNDWDKVPSVSVSACRSTSSLGFTGNAVVLHPNQFHVNEAWIAFQLNETPILTEQDGSFNCVGLMDAASCYLLGYELVSTADMEPSQIQVGRLLQTAWAEKRQFPKTLYLPTGQFQNAMIEEAARQGISVISVQEIELLAFIGEAREGYREHMRLDNQ
jgi:hypothetical protein